MFNVCNIYLLYARYTALQTELHKTYFSCIQTLDNFTFEFSGLSHGTLYCEIRCQYVRDKGSKMVNRGLWKKVPI